MFKERLACVKIHLPTSLAIMLLATLLLLSLTIGSQWMELRCYKLKIEIFV